ncbi:MAG: hypothetical protein J5825_08990 [Lachnospiraceae bacterium]|nr:hypothetical protein [Lachnospiraceae bacterium]
MQLFFKGDKFHLAIDIEQKVFCSDVTEPLVDFPEELESHDYIELSSLQDFRKLYSAIVDEYINIGSDFREDEG